MCVGNVGDQSGDAVQDRGGGRSACVLVRVHYELVFGLAVSAPPRLKLCVENLSEGVVAARDGPGSVVETLRG